MNKYMYKNTVIVHIYNASCCIFNVPRFNFSLFVQRSADGYNL